MAPELSVILPTDSFETIALALDKLRAQTIADRIEVIVVSASADAIAPAQSRSPDFAALQLVQCPGHSLLGVSRAAGIKAAHAPYVFVGETHSFLRPDAAEKLLAVAKSGAWDVVTPGFVNGNPVDLWSWGAFLTAYARWNAAFPAGEIPEAPLYDSVFRKDSLLRLHGSLDELLVHGDNMRLAMAANGCRVYLEPSAILDHVNIEEPGAWLHEHFLIGVVIGARRAREWSWPRRIFYMLASPLIPFVLMRRVWAGLRTIARTHAAPLAAFPLVFLAFVVKAIGEFVGYAGGGTTEHEEMMTHYEVRRFDYVR